MSESWEEFEAELISSGAIVMPAEKKQYNGTAEKASVETVESALAFISPDIPNQEWIIVGMAIKEEFGDAGFSIWDNWSSNGEKYKKREMKIRWNSFGRREGITIGSLFFMAQENGWSPVMAHTDHTPDFILDGKLTGWHPPAQVKPIKKSEKSIFPIELYNAPGLPGELAKFINKTSLMPQPLLALGAAVAAAGSLMGRKVRSDTNLRTNFYIIGLAPSGSGKDHARTVIKRLFHDTGMGNLELGVPASSAGLVSGIRDRGEGRGLVLWDEFGRVLKQIAGWKSGTHEKDIVTAIVELFSSSQSVYMGKQYANHDNKNPIKPIDQPCLSIYATSVPNHFYEALGAGEAIDGFLARWLIFESKDYTLEEEEHEQVFSEVPQAMIDICKYWKDQKFHAADAVGGNLSDMRIVPKLIKSSSAAGKLLKEYAMETRNKAIIAESSGDITGSVWSRAGEHARRLALVAHEGDQIELSVAEWGIKLGQYCCQYNADSIGEYVSSSELESHTKKILRFIKNRNDWVSRADITRAFQGVNNRTRAEILTALVERSEIKEEKIGVATGRPSVKYQAIS